MILSKLSYVVNYDVVIKTVYNKLVAKVNSIDTNAFVLKTKSNTYKRELEKKIPNISSLVKNTDYNTKITEIEGKIPDVSSLATKTASTTVENKTLYVISLVKKQIIIQKLLKLKRKLLIIIMINILLLQSLIH